MWFKCVKWNILWFYFLASQHLKIHPCKKHSGRNNQNLLNTEKKSELAFWIMFPWCIDIIYKGPWRLRYRITHISPQSLIRPAWRLKQSHSFTCPVMFAPTELKVRAQVNTLNVTWQPSPNHTVVSGYKLSCREVDADVEKTTQTHLVRLRKKSRYHLLTGLGKLLSFCFTVREVNLFSRISIPSCMLGLSGDQSRVCHASYLA